MQKLFNWCSCYSFIQAISIASLQVHYYSEVLLHSMNTESEFHAKAWRVRVQN